MQANAEHLSAELPLERGRSVLYPLAEADVAAAREASVAAFASPSALKSWLALVGGQDIADVAIACIGNLQLEIAMELSLRPKHAQAQAWMSIASEALHSLPQGA